MPKAIFYVDSLLFRVAEKMLANAEEFRSKRIDSETKKQYLLASATFSAFCVEALVNHIGSEHLPYWDAIERKLGPAEKLEVVGYSLGIVWDRGRRPLQTVQELLRFRNSFAHPKSYPIAIQDYKMEPEHRTTSITLAGGETRSLAPDWYMELTGERCRRYLEDVREVARVLYSHHDPGMLEDDATFNFNIVTYDFSDGPQYDPFTDLIRQAEKDPLAQLSTDTRGDVIMRWRSGKPRTGRER